MLTIIAGSRRITDPDIIDRAVKASGFTVTSIVEGGQRTRAGGHIIGGVDWLARLWALRNDLRVVTINAEWELHGKAAGPLRNGKMVKLGKQLIAIPDAGSKGTVDIINQAKAKGLPVFIYNALIKESGQES